MNALLWWCVRANGDQHNSLFPGDADIRWIWRTMKRKLPILIFLTSCLMLALATAQPGNRSRQVIALDPTGKYLINQSTGKPTFMTGDSPQTSCKSSNTDVETYLKDRASRKFNALWLLPVDKTDQANAPKNFYGQTPLMDPTLPTRIPLTGRMSIT